MNYSELISKVHFDLSSVAFCRLGREWNYKNIISSFSRLYLITEGEALVYIGKKLLKLKKGYLYLIPSFTHCSYICPEYMEQYYATFTIKLPNALSVYQLFNFRNEIKASHLHFDLFKKLCEVNEDMELPSGNPKIYQNKTNLGIKGIKHRKANNVLLSSGLLNLFLADFIGSTKMNVQTEVHSRISESIKYIHTNLNENLTVDNLAKETCMSSDHYTRKFKELTAQTPMNYINRQRIEKAQLLLNTTSISISEIAFQCGFKSGTYFCKVFKKYINQTPRDFKNNNRLSNESDLINSFVST